jgi:hypothetical protein
MFPEYDINENWFRCLWSSEQEGEWKFEIQDDFKKGQRTQEDREKEKADMYEEKVVPLHLPKFSPSTSEEPPQEGENQARSIRMVIPKGKLWEKRNVPGARQIPRRSL